MDNALKDPQERIDFEKQKAELEDELRSFEADLVSKGTHIDDLAALVDKERESLLKDVEDGTLEYGKDDGRESTNDCGSRLLPHKQMMMTRES